MTRWQKKLKKYQAQAKAKGYTGREIPVVALSWAQESEVQGLDDPGKRVQAIVDLTYEWEGTTTTVEEIAVLARNMRRLAKKVLHQGEPGDAFDLGRMWEQFRFATSPERLAVVERKERIANLVAGRGNANPEVVRAAKAERDKLILAFTVDLVRDGVEIADALERLMAKFSMRGKDNQYPLQRGRLRVFITEARRIVHAEKKKAQQPK